MGNYINEGKSFK